MTGPNSLVERVLKKAHEIEKMARDGEFPEALLSELIVLIAELEFTDEPALQRLSSVKDHLHPKMTIEHFLNFLIPFERLLDRSVRDDQFLVLDQDRKLKAKTQPLYFVLHNLRSAFNVGSIFRTADALGVSKIYLCGYTPAPESEAVKKTSMLTSDLVPTLLVRDLEEVIEELKSQKIKIVALETTTNAASLYQCQFDGPTAFIVGNERFGMDRKILDQCDQIVSIPMQGHKNSLNVAVSLAVVGFEWHRQQIR